MSTAEFTDWLADRAAMNRFAVDRIPFDVLNGWSFEQHTDNLVHDSGRFFTIEGLRVSVDRGDRQWYQPIIRQPEIGVLGILVKEFEGVLHFLMQAKMEPGNPNLLQLSPTVQATRSNHTGVHTGAAVRYIDYFTCADRSGVLVDVLQSEHGSWFHRKSNRNMIVEVFDDVPVHEDFCWLTLGQINDLLHRDNVVNMDSRTVLACVNLDECEPAALHPDTEILSWLNAERAERDLRTECVPLARTLGWTRKEASIDHETGRYFRVVAVSVRADNREVTSWTQPLVEPCGRGVVAFLTRRIDGVAHVLAQARVEAGFGDGVELGPTVQYTPSNYGTDHEHPLFADIVRNADRAHIRYEAVHSEEGGRFLNAENRCVVIDVDDDVVPVDAPRGYRWVTPGQLSSLIRKGRYVNVQARTLLTCLNAMHGGRS